MTENGKKRIGWKVPLVGGILILLAVVLILLTVFVPQAKQKKQMREILDSFLNAEISYILVTDPVYKTGDLLGNDGRELRLDDEKTAALLQKIRAVRDAGFRRAGEEENLPAGSFDLRVFLRATDGSMAQFFVRQSMVGYVDGTVYYTFEACGKTDPIGELYTMLSDWLSAGMDP